MHLHHDLSYSLLFIEEATMRGAAVDVHFDSTYLFIDKPGCNARRGSYRGNHQQKCACTHKSKYVSFPLIGKVEAHNIAFPELSDPALRLLAFSPQAQERILISPVPCQRSMARKQ